MKPVATDDTDEIRSNFRGRGRTEPSPSVVVPLIAAARNESREELQDLWAGLLANALIDKGRKVRVDYFSVVRSMEPADTFVLRCLARSEPAENLAGGAATAHVNLTSEKLALTENELHISLSALLKLGCAQGAVARAALTPFGNGFFDACALVD